MNASTRGSGPSGGPVDDILPEQELFCLTAKSLWVISIRTAVPRTTDGVPLEADYRNGRWLTKAQICLNGDRSPKWRRSASLARVSNGVVPPSEPVDIDPKRIFRDHPERVR